MRFRWCQVFQPDTLQDVTCYHLTLPATVNHFYVAGPHNRHTFVLLHRNAMKAALTGIALALCFSLFGKDDEDSVIVRREYTTVRATSELKIDGDLGDAEWQKINATSGFRQNSPQENADPKFDTEVRIMYDNIGIYIGAMLFDNVPDSIGRQLGIRDDWNVTADQFRIVFDTYNTQQDAFDFSVTASGVQYDSRFSDYNYNAVWRSATKILTNGWSCEILIPWSALRFPTGNNDWGLQMTRSLIRCQEFDQWAITPKGKANPQKYWGLLKGLNDVDPPVRLSLTPYFTTIYQNDDRFGESSPELSFAGGLDLKYGINESFTVDMTLLPDFSQVQSDNVVKNLGAFEQTFQEFRPFFTEGVDLFQRGNLFYSRRIGKTPSGFYSVLYELDSTEVVTKNPSRARLLNATKLSGRNNNGLGIGLLNAFVDNTYATVKDTITGDERKILTEPRSNYNIFVLDKQMKNSSSVYVINTNVIRTGGSRSSNVTGAGIELNNKSNTWGLDANGAVSNVLYPVSGVDGEFTSDIGYKYFLGVRKTSGTWQYGISRTVLSRLWDADDLGLTFDNNFAANRIYVDYYLFNPKWIFNFANSSLSFDYAYNLQTGKPTGLSFNIFNFCTFRNFNNMFLGVELAPIDVYDYFEPRVSGRTFIRTKLFNVFTGFSTNYNKKFSWGIDTYFGSTGVVSPTIPSNPWGGGSVRFTIRPNNRFLMSVSMYAHIDWGDRGWVNIEEDGTIVFGRRVIRNLTPYVEARYVFMKDMSITLTGRYYWATGEYLGYYILREDGGLNDYVTYAGDHDFSFNSINIDVVYQWIFAPGSILSVGYKMNSMMQENPINYSYKYNFITTMQAPQLNQVSVRVLYYLDYQYVTNAMKKNRAKNS